MQREDDEAAAPQGAATAPASLEPAGSDAGSEPREIWRPDYSGLEPVRLLTADPPWPFDDDLPGSGRGASKHYLCGKGREGRPNGMSVEEICAYPIPPLHDDGILLLWRPPTFAEEAFQVMRAWGFRYAGVEGIWHKFRRCTPCQGRGLRLQGRGAQRRMQVCPDCKGEGKFEHIGMGHYLRNAHETFILGVRGKGCALRLRADVRSLFSGLMPMKDGTNEVAHSAKPDVFYEIAASLYPGPRCALFERKRRPDFFCVGNEIVPEPAAASFDVEVEGEAVESEDPA